MLTSVWEQAWAHPSVPEPVAHHKRSLIWHVSTMSPYMLVTAPRKKELFLHFTADNISTQQTALNQALLTTENEMKQDKGLYRDTVDTKLPSS